MISDFSTYFHSMRKIDDNFAVKSNKSRYASCEWNDFFVNRTTIANLAEIWNVIGQRHSEKGKCPMGKGSCRLVPNK